VATLKINRKKKERQDQPLKIEMTDGVLIPQKGEDSIFSAWRIIFYGAIAVLMILVFKDKALTALNNYFTSVDLSSLINAESPYHDIFMFLPDGIATTFQVTILSIILAMIIGLFTGLGRISQNRLINRLATIYVEIIRGIPLLVQLFYIYYALGMIVQVPRITAAVTAMSICFGAYIGEIFRAGIESISKGQMEAALSLGLSRPQAIRKIIIPQTMRVILPPLGNEFIAMLKDSSLVSILAVSDLMKRGREFASQSFDYFETYTIVALIYLILTLFLSRIVAIMEERLKNGRR